MKVFKNERKRAYLNPEGSDRPLISSIPVETLDRARRSGKSGPSCISRIRAAARQQIEHNLALLRPGLGFREVNEKPWRIPEKYVPYRYTLALHGTGMADEWPGVPLHPDFDPRFEGGFEENMVVNVESLIAEDGSESIRLETQALIIATGAERLDMFPLEDV